jgi:hypothetical protein
MHPTRPSPVLSFVVTLALAGAAPAFAQPVDPQKLAAAQPLFTQAQDAMKANDYAKACPKLEEVTRLLPKGLGGLQTLARCYDRAGRLASAWAAYLVAHNVATQEEHRDVEVEKEALEPLLAHITIEVPDVVRALPGLAIERDGVPVGPAQWGTPVAVDKGKHVVVATATGKERWEKPVDVPIDGVDVPVQVAALVDAKSSGLRTAGYVVGGLGLISTGVGAVFGALAISDKNQSGPYCGPNDGSSDPNHCNPMGQKLRSTGLGNAAISTGTFIAGGIVLAGGITLFAVGTAQQSSVRVGVGPRSVEVAGRW